MTVPVRAQIAAAILPLILSCTAVAQIPSDITTVSAQTRFDAAVADVRAAMLIDPKAASLKAAAAAKLTEAIPSARSRNVAIATALWLQGEADYRMDAVAKAGPLIARALKLVRAGAPNTKLEGDILLSSGSVHGAIGQPAQALQSFQAAYAIFRRIGDDRDQAIALICISQLYGDANDHKSALKYSGQALDVYQADPNLSLSIYNNRASDLQEMGNYAEAEKQFTKALEIAKALRSPLLRARILGNIARLRLVAGQINSGQRAIDEALSIAASGDAASWRPQLLAIAAQAAQLRGDFSLAARLIGERFEGVDLTKTTMSFREAHKTAYQTYQAIGDNQLALAHLAALKRLDDQATKLATTTNTALAAARFDYTNQKLKIAALENEQLQRSVAFEQSRARTQRYVFLGATGTTVVIIAMLAIGLFTIRRSRDQVRAANDGLAVSNAALGKALAAKTEFLATTSHEIRTPLNGILGMTQVMLADPRLTGDARDRISVVHGAGVTMRALVDDILDVAKMETGNLTIEEAPFDLKTTLVDATKLWDEQARAKGLSFTVDAADAPDMIVGDAARVRQIAFNLLSNAIKFTSEGGISLRIAAHGDRYDISVTDTGIGIEAGKREEVFESFRQADTSTTRQFGGTGLGLSICRNLARAMKGDVMIESVVGRGSTFTVTLPLIVAPDTAPCVDVAEDGAPGVLILDANPITRAMFKSLVTPSAGAVAVASSVEDAATCLSRGGIALLLIDDATMRRSDDPIAAIRQLGAAARAAGAVSTLLWTGEVPAELQGSIDHLIAKPIAGRALVQQLFAALPAKDAPVPLVSQAA